jgi:hypothetical protein
MSHSSLTSWTQNGPLPPKQVEESPQYNDGQYFSSIGLSIAICGKQNTELTEAH